MRVRRRVEIAAGVHEVFAYFDDLANAAAIVAAPVEITGVDELPGGGRRVTYTMLGRDGTRHSASSEHEEYDPPRRTVARSVQAGVTTTVTREFTPTAGGTRVRVTVRCPPPVRYLGGVIALPLRKPLREGLQSSLAAAKAALEAGGGA